MGLTSLSRNILLSFVLIAVVNVYPPPIPEEFECATLVVLSLSIFLGAIFLTPKQGGAREGTMDKALINVDRFLQGKAPTPGQVDAVMYFNIGEVPSADAAKDGMKKMSEKYSRLREIPVKTSNMADSYWTEPSSPLNLDQHVTEHIVDGGVPELEKKTNQLINELVSFDRPVWHVDIIKTRRAAEADSVVEEDGDENIGGVVLLRIHHAIGDGLRMVGAFGDAMTFRDGSPATLELLSKMSAKKSKSPRPSLITLPFKFLGDLFAALTLDSLKPEPTSAVHKSDSILPNDQPRATYTGWVPFQHVKDIRAATPGATINDVILSAFCGAIRQYGAKKGQPISADSFMRSMCAFSMPDRKSKDPGQLYNDFLMPSMNLPTNVEGRLERVAAVQKVMGELKVSMVGPIQEKLVTMLSSLGLDSMLSDTQMKVFAKHSFVYSNVPGFEQDVFLFDKNSLVRKCAVYYPNILSQCIFLTFRGQLSFSLVTDEGAVPDVPMLVDLFVEEIIDWKNQVAKE